MAFIILGDQEQEWERRPLRQAITIGRSFDCDLPIRDTLLSRKHCRLEQHGSQWVLIDLKSRNGTRIGEEPVTSHVLDDGDIIRIGQTRVCFRAGNFVPALVPTPISPRNRPLDPNEAMAMTMTGADFDASEFEPSMAGFPTPQPRPVEPKAYQRDGVETLVSHIASGTWDSRLAKQALVRRPAQLQPWPSEAPATVASDVANKPAVRLPKDADYGGRRPARWLVLTYLCMAASVFLASLCVIVWPRI